MGHEHGAGDQARALAKKLRERDEANNSNLKPPPEWYETMADELEKQKKGDKE